MIAGNLKPKTPGQWLKLALIPALSLTLLVVLWQQNQPESDVAETPTDSLPDSSASDAVTPQAIAQVELTKPTWPKARLEDVIAFNPFESQPEADTEEESEDAASDNTSATARGSGKPDPRLAALGDLRAIFVDAQGAAAILGSQVVRVGDTLPSGGRVVEITAEGIKLEGL